MSADIRLIIERVRRFALRNRVRRVSLSIATLTLLSASVFAIAWFTSPCPTAKLLDPPASAAVFDSSGCLLAQTVARDDQWRFPIPLAQISPWLIQATIAVEDERFASHPGVDPIAAARACWQNISAMRVRSGASTLTMQLARMADPRPRTIRAKAVQSLHALQLDRRLSKDAQLECYFNHAPYGGNVSGAEAAARQYFSKSTRDLTLGQAALLAGLPQSPTRYRPDRHPKRAIARRGVVLDRMYELKMISSAQFEEANAEPVALAGVSSLNIAPHFADLALSRRSCGGATLLRRDIQLDVNRLAAEHVHLLPSGTDIAVVAIDIDSGDLVALVGGIRAHDELTGRVNGATARRSPGSALKPFIYAAAMDADLLDANTIVYDMHIDRDGWTPDNFDRVTLGPLPAAQALRRSRNVPAILITEAVGLARCTGLLESLGVRMNAGRPEAAGLALATGAVEVSLLDLTNAYAAIGRGGEYMAARIFPDESAVRRFALSRRACETLDDILSLTARQPNGIESDDSGEPSWFMWKTGTSSGRRDAWAVGHNRRFSIGVWVGRLQGGGHAAQVGARAAEPLLARLFALASVRNDSPPPAMKSWHAAHPMPAPTELAGPTRILSPADGATFIATDATLSLPVRANRPLRAATWFLDGKLMVLQEGDATVTVAPGSHELACRDDRNITTRVSFTVESPTHPGALAAKR